MNPASGLRLNDCDTLGRSFENLESLLESFTHNLP